MMKEQITKTGFLHGGDYNPEQWLKQPEILEKDIAYFKKAHINTVTLGVFSWAAMEPAEGEFQFEWLERVIGNLYENGISVILSTPSAARPKWLADKYPQVLRVDENRQRNLFGGRHNHCYTSPVYRRKVQIINGELARRFEHHPAVLMWHIANEFGGECHCPLCQEKFREWLKERYGTIEHLNDRWCTSFWSHSYGSFEEIESPSPRGEMELHGLRLDWKRFVTERTVDYLKFEIDVLREAGVKKPCTANLMYDYDGHNYQKFKEVLDVVSWDNYPAWHKQEEWLTATDCGMQHDFMRSIKKQPFLLMESCPSATNWQPVSKLKKPGVLLLSSLQAVAHGSDSVLYFQMRQSRGSSEKLHGAVIDHYGGSDTRVFQEVTRVGEALEQIGEITGSRTVAKAAVLYDRESHWAMEESQGPRNEGMHHKECVMKHYRGLRRLGMNVDIISMEHELSDYQIVAVPMAYMFREGYAETLRTFTEGGGTLILTYWSGIADDTDRCYLGGTPYGLMDVIGVRSTEMDALYDWEENRALPEAGNRLGLTEGYDCKNFCDLVRVLDAEVLMRYEKDFYQGWPVLTHKGYGTGHAYYICTDMEQSFYDAFYKEIVKEAGIPLELSDIPEGVSVTTRENEWARYLFLQNFGSREAEIALPDSYEIIYGEEIGRLKVFETRIYRKRH